MKKNKLKFYFTLMSVQCIAKWFVLYLGKAGFTTLQHNFLHSTYFQVIVHVHVCSRRKGDSFRTLANLHEKEKRKSRNVEIALSTEELHMSQHFSLGLFCRSVGVVSILLYFLVSRIESAKVDIK